MAITNTAVTVATTATVIAALDPTRRTLLFQNPNANTIFVGGSGVTTANGHPVLQNTTFQLNQSLREDITVQQAWFGIVATSTEVLRVTLVDN